MIGNKCFTFRSCVNQDELVYIQATRDSDVDVFLSTQGGLVLEINDPIHFPDTNYTLINICTAFIFCPECYEAEVVLYDDFGRNLNATGSSQCPTPEEAYVLSNCRYTGTFGDPEDINQSPDTLLVTSSNLLVYVGMVVTLEEYPGNCYTVYGPYTELTGCPCEYVTVQNASGDCTCCLGEDPKPPLERVIPKPVRVFYHITDTECEIRDNTTFANNYYKLFTGIRYGIKNCCGDVDFEKLWIKKELSDYSRINPPVTCAPPVVEVCPDPCPAPEPLGCLPVQDVIAAGTFV